ncbi:DUF6266 family protein [Pedobacter sp. JCM 36344]|uniref:DUF6266 family protein n=1 Tax=Pedobacter sp. JCM 36344 TaxID=3374280 RepID=UPI00397CF5DE
MGILKNGLNGPVKGRVGKIVYYELNGQNVSRSIGVIPENWTIPQLSVRMKTSISSKLLKHLKAFFNVGFSIEIKGTTQNTFNMAVGINSQKMMTGVYPNFNVDFSKLVLSRGLLNPGADLQASVTEEVISFTWAATPTMQWPESTDLVMMIAYFPEKERSLVTIGGNARNTGADQLTLPPSLKGLRAETYIAFVAADRKQVSDSTYLGSLNLTIQ